VRELISQTEPEVLELVVAKRPGRKRKLTDKLLEKIMASIEEGNHTNTACRNNGLSERTLFSRVNRDSHAAKRFADAKSLRLQKWHELWLSEMCEHSKRSPMATAFLLERNFPHLYAMKQVNRPEQTISNNADAITKEVLLTLPVDEFNEIKAMEDTRIISDTELEHIEHGTKMTVYLLEQHGT
jgi:hypothetical protein